MDTKYGRHHIKPINASKVSNEWIRTQALKHKAADAHPNRRAVPTQSSTEPNPKREQHNHTNAQMLSNVPAQEQKLSACNVPYTEPSSF